MHLVWVQNVKYFNAGYNVLRGFPGGSVVKNLLAKAGDSGSVSGLGRSHGEGNGSPLPYSLLGNPMDRGTWWATVHGGHKKARHDLTAKQQCTCPLVISLGDMRAALVF